MDIKVRAQNNNNDKALLREAKVSVVIDPDAWSEEDFQTWLDAFRNRYAEALEYLRSH